MLWKTHLRISFEVLRKLGIFSLPNEVAQSFKTGIITPDQLKDYPHHYGKSESIKEHLMRSRGYFLQDDWPNAFFNLGVALHYIQDSYTSMPSDYPEHHHNWEVSIEYANFTSDLKETITCSLGNNGYERDRCLKIANILSEKAQGRDNTLYVATLSGHAASKSFAEPIVDLNLGLRASYVVTESVLSSKNCPALEVKLREVLSNYEALMRTAEVELSNKIIRLANERDKLRKRKVPQSGIVSKMKNGILGIRIGLKDSAVNSNNNYYTQQKHLEKYIREYMEAANMTVTPYSGWYNFQIPRISPSVVSWELLSVQEIGGVLGENENVLKESLSRVNVSTYHVGSRELVTRAELDRFLSQFPVKGFTKSPL
jgi:hypothetical protein